MAPCGLYCGVCAIYLATRDKNEKFKAVLANLYGTKPEEIECYGCMQADPLKKLFSFCRTCPHQGMHTVKRILFVPPMQ